MATNIDRLIEQIKLLSNAEKFELVRRLDKESVFSNTEKADDEDFWTLSSEDEQHFNDLLHKSTKDLNNKRYTEYSKP
jgi:hypothetical protein